ncbi:MAG TPA: PIN domain-containing protein [Candidatus Acetothermia bacterium]|nr:PIN domain-containing protein [Candidatus Acetothermia bacterium]
MPRLDAVFVDTSALYAVLDRDDEHHMVANVIWKRLLRSDRPLLTHSYVLVETYALVQRRLGLEAVRALHHDVVPILDVVWVNEDIHRPAVEALLAAGSRSVSLVDQVSFSVMRREGIRQAFVFDEDFERQGFISYADVNDVEEDQRK